MKKLIGSILASMTIVAIVYCNYHAIKDSAPFFRHQLDRIRGSKAVTRMSGWCSRVTESNIVQGTKAKASSAGGRVVHMFKRREEA